MPVRRLTLNETLRAAVHACGGPKVVGCAMLPTKSADYAQTRIDNILDRSRRAHFSDDEIDFLRAWCHQIGAVEPWAGWDAKYGCEMRHLDQNAIVAELQTRAVEIAAEARQLNQDLEAITGLSPATLERMRHANLKVGG